MFVFQFKEKVSEILTGLNVAKIKELRELT